MFFTLVKFLPGQVSEIKKQNMNFPSPNGLHYCSLKADELTRESIAAWITKFNQMKDIDSILANSPEDLCYICYESLKDILSTGDLAVVAECDHIFCLSCMEQIVDYSPTR